LEEHPAYHVPRILSPNSNLQTIPFLYLSFFFFNSVPIDLPFRPVTCSCPSFLPPHRSFVHFFLSLPPLHQPLFFKFFTSLFPFRISFPSPFGPLQFMVPPPRLLSSPQMDLLAPFSYVPPLGVVSSFYFHGVSSFPSTFLRDPL